MANHLESVCMRGPHDLDLVDDLAGMPYLRCVTGTLDEQKKLKAKQLVVTSLTEGHRIASTYFLGEVNERTKKWNEKGGQRIWNDGTVEGKSFGDELANSFGIVPEDDVFGGRGHPPPDKWWDVFKTIFKYDPNALVHGVLFPQWQIKVPRFLTAHLEAFGASRVDRSGVKFDRLGKTTSGQPIFAVDDSTAREIRATFVLDLALLRSFGRQDEDKGKRGLTNEQKEFLAALALWKIDRLLKQPFRFRSGCHLECIGLKVGTPQQNDGSGDEQKRPLIQIEVRMKEFIESASFRNECNKSPVITEIYWPPQELYSKAEPTRRRGSADTDRDGEGADGGDDDNMA
jgi:CRISPR-associated protein Csb1